MSTLKQQAKMEKNNSRDVNLVCRRCNICRKNEPLYEAFEVKNKSKPKKDLAPEDFYKSCIDCRLKEEKKKELKNSLTELTEIQCKGKLCKGKMLPVSEFDTKKSGNFYVQCRNCRLQTKK